MMKRIGSLILALALVLGLCACGESKQARWQEQYDLGMKYLSELNYEEAVAAFTEAIAIDAKRPEAYIGRGDAYVGIGTSETLTSARADYETALTLDNSLADAWLGLINACILQGDYEGAQRALEQALAVLDPALLQEKQEELARLNAPEPGSEEFLRAAEAHLDPAVDFDFAINGVPFATSDIYTVASQIGGGKLERDANGTTLFYDQFYCQQKPGHSYVDILGFTNISGFVESGLPFWPSEYCAGITLTDTLDQALEKLGFTETERAWLATRGQIRLTCYADGSWYLAVSDPATVGCGLEIMKEDVKLMYTFYYGMEEAGLDAGTPVDGRAAVRTMYVANYQD